MVLVILGGVSTLLGGVFGMAALLTERRLPSLDSLATIVTYGVLMIILGIVALAGVGRVKTVVWDVVLIIVGLVAYRLGGGFPWSWGSILIVAGGIVGIIAVLA